MGPPAGCPAWSPGGRLTLADWTSAPPGAPEGSVELYFRPNEVSLAPADGPGFSARVLHAGVRGASGKIECAVGEAVLELEAATSPRPTFLARGADIRVTPDRYKLYPRAE